MDTPSPLFRLPPELRDHIYHLLFTTTYATTLRPTRTQHPLTRTSRLLRHEALPLYLSLTRFNAHLDDGPAAPLAAWLRALGPERCLLLRELNVWDLHMLHGSLHGAKATEGMLRTGRLSIHELAGALDDDDDDDDDGPPRPRQERPQYVLRPLGRDVSPGSGYLSDLLPALQTLGLRLRRFCQVLDGPSSPSSNGTQLKQTSHFAIQRLVSDGSGDDDACGVAGQLGLDDDEECEEVLRALEGGERRVRVLEGGGEERVAGV